MKARVGDIVKIDSWRASSLIEEGFAYFDESKRNWDFFIESENLPGVKYPANIKITSRESTIKMKHCTLRCTVEFVVEGEHSFSVEANYIRSQIA